MARAKTTAAPPAKPTVRVETKLTERVTIEVLDGDSKRFLGYLHLGSTVDTDLARTSKAARGPVQDLDAALWANAMAMKGSPLHGLLRDGNVRVLSA